MTIKSIQCLYVISLYFVPADVRGAWKWEKGSVGKINSKTFTGWLPTGNILSLRTPVWSWCLNNGKLGNRTQQLIGDIISLWLYIVTGLILYGKPHNSKHSLDFFHKRVNFQVFIANAYKKAIIFDKVLRKWTSVLAGLGLIYHRCFTQHIFSSLNLGKKQHEI